MNFPQNPKTNKFRSVYDIWMGNVSFMTIVAPSISVSTPNTISISPRSDTITTGTWHLTTKPLKRDYHYDLRSNALICHPSCWHVVMVRSVVCLGDIDRNLPSAICNPAVKWSSSFQNCVESSISTANTDRTPVVRSHFRVGGSRKRRSNLNAFRAEIVYSGEWSKEISAKHSAMSSSSRYSGR